MADGIRDSDDEFEWDTDGDNEVVGRLNGTGTSAAGSRNLDAPGPSTLNGIRDSDDEFEWDTDGDNEVAGSLNGAGTSAAGSRNLDAPGPSTLAGPSSSLAEHFVGMGFEEKMVLKALEENEDRGAESLLELLLTYQVIDNDNNCYNSVCGSRAVDNEDDDEDILENWDDEDAGGTNNRVLNSHDSDDEDFLQELSEKDAKLESLVNMGFPEDEANMAILRCGHDASIPVLVDSIYASETAGTGYYGNFSDREDGFCGGRKKKRFMEGNAKRRKRYGDEAQGSRGPFDGSQDVPMPLPKPMIGFGLPDERLRFVDRSLPSDAIGPPFFYYENVALTPKGVWQTISRFLYDVQPEFVDSKYFCAATRKRGYIHNLPLANRSQLLPLPPKTIFEAFPHTRKWWPSWDPRRQLNCLQTCTASAKLVEEIRLELNSYEDPPPQRIQQKVMNDCRKWNLVWVGRNKVAPLEPHEMEFLLGFPVDHTRGINRTDRYKALGNSFQVDTVAYHLSVLKDMFPHGMNVLSLFSGIGGAEVALHRLGIRMKTVVSVENSKKSRTVLQSWWDNTQTGTLIEITDVQTLTAEKLESLIKRIGGFDLVIGGSPCNNLAGSNRHHRDGLEGEHSALFFHYFRIVGEVRSIMARM